MFGLRLKFGTSTNELLKNKVDTHRQISTRFVFLQFFAKLKNKLRNQINQSG